MIALIVGSGRLIIYLRKRYSPLARMQMCAFWQKVAFVYIVLLELVGNAYIKGKYFKVFLGKFAETYYLESQAAIA